MLNTQFVFVRVTLISLPPGATWNSNQKLVFFSFFLRALHDFGETGACGGQEHHPHASLQECVPHPPRPPTIICGHHHRRGVLFFFIMYLFYHLPQNFGHKSGH